MVILFATIIQCLLAMLVCADTNPIPNEWIDLSNPSSPWSDGAKLNADDKLTTLYHSDRCAVQMGEKIDNSVSDIAGARIQAKFTESFLINELLILFPDDLVDGSVSDVAIMTSNVSIYAGSGIG